MNLKWCRCPAALSRSTFGCCSFTTTITSVLTHSLTHWKANLSHWKNPGYSAYHASHNSNQVIAFPHWHVLDFCLQKLYYISSSGLIALDHSSNVHSPRPGTGEINITGEDEMGGFDPREINPLDCDRSIAEKSLGTYKLLVYLNYSCSLTTIRTENQQFDSSSTFSDRGSEPLSVFDPNYDSNSESVLGVCLRLIIFNALKFCHLLISSEDDSPYPEVRSAVANYDDPEMPASTIRAWILGIAWSILLSGLNQFFYLRYPSVTIGNVRTKISFLLTKIRNNI